MVRQAKGKRRYVSSDDIFNTVLLVFLAFCFIIVLYPLIFVLSSSFSSGDAIVSGQIYLWPVDFTTKGYELVFANKSIGMAALNSLWIVVFNTLVSLILEVLAAYPLSRKGFQGRGFYQILFLIPMYFGGGLIPTYLNMSRLGLVNSRIGFIIGAGINFSGIIVVRSFFQTSVPGELLEAGKMDGITDITYLTKIVLPLSKAVMAVQTMGIALGNWNAYVGPMIYLRDRELQPLTIIMREILASARIQADSFTGSAALMAQMSNSVEVMQYALIVITTFPIIMFVPMMQKHFQKGVLIGTLKG